MMNVESKLWKVYVPMGCQIAVLQKASGMQLYVTIGKFPNFETLAAMTERQFDKICRNAFHNWKD